MATVDQRTRFQGDVIALDPSTFLDEHLPPLLEAHGPGAGADATRLGLVPLTLDVDGEQLTFALTDDDRLEVRRGASDALVVGLDRDAFSDLMQDVASTFGLVLAGRMELRTGEFDAYIRWEPVLRALLDGRRAYVPGTIDFVDRAGDPLDLHRSFTLDDAPEEIGHFLAEAGFVHLQGLFTEAEMAAVAADHDDAIANAAQDDGASWWARTEDEGWYAARILGFNHQSPALREVLASERFAAIAGFTDDLWEQRDFLAADAAEGLLKKIGVVEGASDVSWHKDCAPGGHSRGCCGMVVGISVTGAGPENGELGVVAGSHRANVVQLGIEGLDLPRLPLPTQTGDVTIHCSCTLHMSRPPVSAERRVVYTGFGLAPRPGDHVAEVDPAEVRRQRAAQNDHSRRAQRESQQSSLVASFDL